MRRRVLQTISLSLISLAPLLAGCSDGSRDHAPEHKPAVVLGFSPIVSWGNWNGANADSVRKAAHDAGIEVRLEDARHSQEKQMATLRSFVQQRVDVIAFSPVVETGWDVVLRDIRSAGIPVILMDRTIEVSDESLYVSMIGSDFVEEGRRAGRWLIENTRDVRGEIDIVELQGTVDSPPANGRSQGFGEIIAADPRYRIVRSQNADYDLARAREVMAEFLETRGHRIRVLFAHNDSMALGAIEAIEAAKLKPGSDILVIGIEGSRKGLEAIVSGKMNVTVECSPFLGPQLMSIVRDAVAGKAVPKRVVTHEAVFTRENAAAELPNRAY